jgi:outer membrane lipoprotein carrier protein
MRIRTFILIQLAVLTLLQYSVCHAGSISALDGLEALRKGLSNTSDFTAEIVQEKQLSIMKRVMTTHGTVRFKKPGLFQMEIKPPYPSKLLLNDNVIEQSSGRDGNKNRIILPPEQSLKQWLTKLSAPVTKLPEDVDIRAEQSGSLYTLHIAPVKKGQIKGLTIIFLGDGTIRKIVINEQNGDRATMTFKKFRRNTGLTDKDLFL